MGAVAKTIGRSGGWGLRQAGQPAVGSFVSTETNRTNLKLPTSPVRFRKPHCWIPIVLWQFEKVEQLEWIPQNDRDGSGICLGPSANFPRVHTPSGGFDKSMTAALMLGSPRCPGSMGKAPWPSNIAFLIVVTHDTTIFYEHVPQSVLQSAYLPHSVNRPKISYGCSVCYYVIAT